MKKSKLLTLILLAALVGTYVFAQTPKNEIDKSTLDYLDGKLKVDEMFLEISNRKARVTVQTSGMVAEQLCDLEIYQRNHGYRKAYGVRGDRCNGYFRETYTETPFNLRKGEIAPSYKVLKVIEYSNSQRACVQNQLDQMRLALQTTAYRAFLASLEVTDLRLNVTDNSPRKDIPSIPDKDLKYGMGISHDPILSFEIVIKSNNQCMFFSANDILAQAEVWKRDPRVQKILETKALQLRLYSTLKALP